ncbi:hypothetical protein J3459_018083 [Metarhizium acridum]|uniref:uncharacterized protein n=1 Tax=Metarhizium acridum TaxID=92637 RepID=UPI001C6D1548|nr:hypothetical protein J3459_018083 [Metarhizium acridum]KAG8410279.1 hypothetical protein J3458_017992 [Metarhizium acridum]
MIVLSVYTACLNYYTVSDERVLGITGNIAPELTPSTAPAQDAIRYEVKKFHRGFGEQKTIYQGDPSPEVDKIWKSLYNEIGISRLSREQAELLPNRTYPFMGDDGYYIAELAVFHQLHCVNVIRIALFKDYYQTVLSPEEFDDVQGSYGRDHISHCLDAVREAIMCASDVSVITWQWNDQAKKALGHGDVLHTCRSFEKIQEWAAENQAVVDFNAEIFVKGDPVVDGVD